MGVMEEIWAKAAAAVRGGLTDPQYIFWFEPLRPVLLDESQIVLLAKDQTMKNMLLSRYVPMIDAALSQVAGRRLNCKIILEQELGQYQQVKTPSRSSSLNPRYVFDSYVVGESNQFSVAASKAVAESPGRSYNPLFIYGGVGLGKTHLMHAIGNFISSHNPSATVVYVSSETFMNEMIESIRSDKNAEFRNKYRGVDVLLIDDIQFIAGKDATEMEFFHTFNALYESSKQIVISSDKSPKEIPTLEERLRSRFEWGLSTDIQRPGYEMRMAILKKKADLENISIPDEINRYIADLIESNIRELEGALTRVIAYSQLTGKRISIDLAKEALRSLIPENTHRITPERIILAVAAQFAVNREDLFSKRRNQSVALPRQYAMYLCREMTDLSLPKIGELFGGRDHTTVIHACEKIGRMIVSDPSVQMILEDIKHRVIVG